ncbi:putative S-layer protein [Candidatus Woesearchaeota archaeon]|nr:hypothetical protein [uncultured archaeon]MBS3167278.1 putative S-layer protein [Candidatus Woesearchaeota archaeon]
MKNKFLFSILATLVLGIFLVSAATVGDIRISQASTSITANSGETYSSSFVLSTNNAIERIPKIFYATFDNSLTSDSGTPLSGFATITGYSDAQFAQAANLSVGSKLAYATANNLNESAGTIEFWFKPEFNKADGKNHIFFFLEGSTPNTIGVSNSLVIFKDSLGRLMFRNQGSPDYRTADTTDFTIDNSWHYLVATYDSSSMKLYYDGVKKVEWAQAPVLAITATKFMIGSDYNGANTADSLIDDFRISKRALTATEVSEIYTSKAVHTDADYTLTYNAKLANVTLTSIDLTSTTDSTKKVNSSLVTFTTNNLDIFYGDSTTVNYQIAIPPYQATGTYTGTISAKSQDNANEATYAVSLTIPESKGLTVDGTTLIVTPADSTKSTSFTIKNTGNIDLSAITATYNQSLLTDRLNKTITLTFSKPSFNLISGESTGLDVTANLPSGLEFGKYVTQITFGNSVTSKVLDFTIRVEPDMCEDGEVGSYVKIVDINEPDAGDSFKPGQEISVEVEARNDDLDDKKDITVEAFLFNVDTMEDDEDYLSTAKVTNELKKETSKTVTLKLIMPYEDLDEDDHYMVIVKAYDDDKEDEQCIQKSVAIEASTESRDIYIKSVDLSGTNKAVCGSTNYLAVTLVNNGEKDDEKQYVQIKNTALNLNEYSTKQDIDSEDSADYKIPFVIPETAKAGIYSIEVIAFYNDGKDSKSRFIDLVLDCAGTSTIVKPSSVELKTVTTALDFSQEDNRLHLLITNNNDKDIEAYLSVTSVGDWFSAIDTRSETLHAGDNNIYIDITPKGNLTTSEKTAIVTLKARGTSSFDPIEKTLSVSVTPAAQKVNKLKEWYSSASSKQTGIMWILIDAVLILFAIFLVKSIYSGVRSKKADYSEKELRRMDKQQKKLI